MTRARGGRLWLVLAGALSAACATAAQASPPDAGAPAARGPRDDRGLRRRDPFRLAIPPGGWFMLARRGQLGLELLDLTPELREHFGAPRDAGLLVARVTADGPAAKAGVRVGDVLTAVDGETVADDSAVRRRVRGKKENEIATVEVIRNRGKQTFKVAVARKDTTELDVGAFAEGDPSFHFDPGRINDAVDLAMRQLERPEFRERLERRRESEEKLQERTRALEERIEKLERQLQGKK